MKTPPVRLLLVKDIGPTGAEDIEDSGTPSPFEEVHSLEVTIKLSTL